MPGSHGVEVVWWTHCRLISIASMDLIKPERRDCKWKRTYPAGGIDVEIATEVDTMVTAGSTCVEMEMTAGGTEVTVENWVMAGSVWTETVVEIETDIDVLIL